MKLDDWLLRILLSMLGVIIISLSAAASFGAWVGVLREAGLWL